MKKDRLQIWKRCLIELYATQPPKAFPANNYLFNKQTAQGLKFSKYNIILTQALRENHVLYVYKKETTHHTTKFAKAAKKQYQQAYIKANTNHMAGVKYPKKNINRATNIKHIKS